MTGPIMQVGDDIAAAQANGADRCQQRVSSSAAHRLRWPKALPDDARRVVSSRPSRVALFDGR